MPNTRLSLYSDGGVAQLSLPKSPLFELPLEIRIIIYTFLLVSHDILCPNVKDIFDYVQSKEQTETSFLTLPHEQTLAIARTCTRVRDEVLPVYFGSNKFMFKDTWDMSAYLHMIGDRCALIRSLSFVYRGQHRKKAFELLSKCMNLDSLDVMVLNETMKGARMPQKNILTAQGMHSLRANRGLVHCKVTVREVVAIQRGNWRHRELVFSLNTGDKRRFDRGHIREVESILTDDLQKEEDDTEVRLKRDRERGREERKAKRDREHEIWRANEEKEWEEFMKKEATRLGRQDKIQG